MSYYGDIRLGDTIDIKFTTAEPDTGAPITLAGTPVISAYVGNSTTQITAGITLTVDFDGVTGLHNVRVVASGGNGYATASNYDLIITTGTVDTVSAVGYKVASFSIEARSALMPTTVTRTLDVSAAGEAGIDLANISALPAGAIAAYGIVDNGTAQSATGTTLVLRAAAAFADDELNGATIVIASATLGAGQRRIITDYVSTTDTATVDTWTTTPTGTIVYVIYGSPPASTSAPATANVTQWLGTACASPTVAGVPEVDLTHVAGATTNVSTLATDVAVIEGLLDTELPALTAAVDALPTNAELATALGTADDAVLAAIAAVQSDTNDIQTRLPAALNNGVMPADVQRVNDVNIVGDGSATPWGP